MAPVSGYLFRAADWGRAVAPGLAFTAVIAAASLFIAEHQGGSSLLYALLLGMALKSVTGASALPGIALSSRTLLRVGVALLGLRIGLEQIVALGAPAALALTGAVALTIFAGVALARRLGLGWSFGFLSGGATAICGASAALAIASLLPKDKDAERNASFTVVAVTSLATLGMILAPPALRALGVDDATAGFIIGGSIHDVAQVVGAGYSLSTQAGDVATVTKLFRVALLVPVTLALTLFIASPASTDGARQRRFGIPWFLALFLALAALHSCVSLPASLTDGAALASRWCFALAMAGVGLKTSLGDFRSIGGKALLLVLAETAFLALLVVSAALWGVHAG